MKISVNWLKKFTDIDLSVDELVTKIGAQLGAVEEVIDLGKTYQHIVIAEVISCQKHPNADKLSICKIDDGGKVQDVDRDENGHVQVVCGAPNVREGLKVAWLPPGATVPSTIDKDPFVLGSRELRGVMSSGMIASAAELAIGDDHDGILELDTDAAAGSDFAEVFELNDYIIDIENKMFTHRPDCFGVLGVAREVAGIQQIPFRSPEWYLQSKEQRARINDAAVELQVENKAGDLVPRFMVVAMTDVAVKPSPLQMQTYLTRVGLKPINNIVDITNYIMYLTGQPLHAYDTDKLREVASSKNQVVRLESRLSRKGDKLNLLNGKELELQDDSTVLITSGDVPVGVGGVMGGLETEVDENTQNIVLECANFDMYSIRRTSMKYGLFTDAVTRFNKGQSALQNDAVINEAVKTIQRISDASVASEFVDVQSQESSAEAQEVRVKADFINVRLGLGLSAKEMAKLLQNVEFGVEVNDNNELLVTVPFWRTDIEIAEDIVEEVGRLYGFDHLPVELPKRSIMPAKRDEMLSLKNRIRDILSRAGANEVLTYSFVHGNLIEKAGQDKEQAFKLSNALSPDLQYYRLSLTPSLLDKIRPNVKAGYDEFAVFEIGKSHNKAVVDDAGLPDEIPGLALVFASNKPIEGAPYFQALKYLDQLLGSLGVEYYVQPHDEPPFHQVTLPFDPKRSGFIRGRKTGTIGIVGELKPSVRKAFKLPENVAAVEITFEALENLDLKNAHKYRPLSRFPKVEQDISLKSSKDQAYSQLFEELQNGLRELADEHLQAELMPLDIYQKDKDKHFTFRLTAAHTQKTLKSSEINELLDKLADRAKAKFNTERI